MKVLRLQLERGELILIVGVEIEQIFVSLLFRVMSLSVLWII